MSDLPVSERAREAATNDDAVEILAMQLADRAFAVGESGDPWTWRDIAEYVDEHEARATAKLQAENARLREALKPFAEKRTIAEIMARAGDDEFRNASPEDRVKLLGERKRANDEAVLSARTALQHGDSNDG